MKSNHITYEFGKSLLRIDEILNASNDEFEEVWNDIPSRDKLTFTNWFYVTCTALFVDIRWSSKLSDSHTRPVLAKIYRAYISEVIAVINWNDRCREINIHGDSVWGVFETPKKVDVDSVFHVAYTVASLIDVINFKLQKKWFKEISIGIGIDDWRALMIKAWYNGSWINDVVWMWEVVNQASKLCSYWNRGFSDKEIMVSSLIYDNLNDHNKSLLSWNQDRNCYNWYVINTNINDWIKAQ